MHRLTGYQSQGLNVKLFPIQDKFPGGADMPGDFNPKRQRGNGLWFAVSIQFA